MIMKRMLYLIPAVWLCSACRQETPTATDAPIYLSASVERPVESRVPYLSAPAPVPSEVLHAAVWATNTVPRAYTGIGWNGKNNGDVVDIYGTADFDDGQPKLLNNAVYPQSGVQVDFIGLHPQEGWATENSEGKKAIFTFDGSHDVMFASRKTGTYAETNDIANVLELNFQHLLTWLKIKIKAENEMVAKSWGKVLEMKISSKNNVSIDLTKDYTFDECVSFFGDEDRLSLRKTGTDNVFPDAGGFDLTNTERYNEEAYVLCQPVMATKYDMGDPTAEYSLYIRTERREVVLPIDLRQNENDGFEGSTRAKHFTLNLNFMVGNIVTIQAEVTDWVFDSSNSIDKDVDF